MISYKSVDQVEVTHAIRGSESYWSFGNTTGILLAGKGSNLSSKYQ